MEIKLNTNEQVWIRGYEGIYSIRSDGQIRSHDRLVEYKDGRTKLLKGRWLKPGKDAQGYHLVLLYKDKQRTMYKVHRLVAEAFITNTDNLPVVNHKDKDVSNNDVSNLEWCSVQYNTEYSISNCYKLVSPSGDLVEVVNLKKFCRDNNLNASNL